MSKTPRFSPLPRARPSLSLLLPVLLLFMAGFPVSSRAEAGAASPPLRFVGDRDYPPVEFTENGQAKGVYPDLVRALGTVDGRPVAVTLLAWTAAQQMVQDGAADALGLMSVTDERKSRFSFTDTVAEVEFSFFVRSDRTGISRFDDLKGKSVGVTAGGFPRQFLKNSGDISPVPVADYQDGLRQLEKGSIEAFAADKAVMLYYLQREGIRNVKVLERPFAVSKVAIAVRKGNLRLVEELNRSLTRLRGQGTLREILEKWSGKQVVLLTREKMKRTIALALGVAGLILIGVLFFWIYTLKRQVVERKAAEGFARESASRFRNIFENAPVAIGIGEVEGGRLVEVNDAWLKLYGYRPDEVIGKTTHELGLYVDARERDELVRLIREQGKVMNHATRLRHKSGAVLDVLYFAEIFVLDSKPYLQVMMSDITEQKRAEESLKRSESTYRELVEGTSDLVTRLDAEGRFLFVNSNAPIYFGCPAEECVGRSALDFVHPDDRARTQAAFVGWVAGGLASTTFENRQVGLNGEVHDLLWTINFHYDDGVLKQVNSIARDVGEQRSLHNEQIKNQKLESLGVLAGGIAHDFNNILTGIVGGVSMARTLLGSPEKAAPLLQQAERAGQRAAELAQQLLTFAKGNLPVKKLVSARSLVDSSVALMLSGSSVQCVVEMPGDLFDLEVDEGQISQAFNNVILNASQSMHGGGTIVVRAANMSPREVIECSLPLGRYVRFSFADTGCGISEEDLKRIFDPYFTTKASGSGLGLASVHSIVKKHGGLVPVRSRLGGGTTFEVLLPASAAKAPAEALPASAAADGGERGGAVLVMDDEDVIRELAAAMLGELGYEVTTCSEGEQAIALYRAALEGHKPFCAVIMDLTVPGGIGGKEASRRILDLDPAAPLIVSSGYSHDPIMDRYREFGFAAMLAKPYDLAAISQAMDKLSRRNSPR